MVKPTPSHSLTLPPFRTKNAATNLILPIQDGGSVEKGQGFGEGEENEWDFRVLLDEGNFGIFKKRVENSLVTTHFCRVSLIEIQVENLNPKMKSQFLGCFCFENWVKLSVEKFISENSDAVLVWPPD